MEPTEAAAIQATAPVNHEAVLFKIVEMQMDMAKNKLTNPPWKSVP